MTSIPVAVSATGISDSDIERIFQPFLTTKSQGTGLELAICRSIFAANGGHLLASRTLPYGSVFRVGLLSTVEEKRAFIF